MARADAVLEPDAVTPPPARRNGLLTRRDWDAEREACERDPGAYHGNVAAHTLHWFDPETGDDGAWLTFDAGTSEWSGWDAKSLEPVTSKRGADWRPWTRALNDDDAPWYRWFEGARTNAAFNEIDRHVLAGFGDEPAFLVEGDRWDQSRDGGRGAPVVSYPLTRKALLLDVAAAALALRALGLRTGDRIALNLPNIPEQIAWTEAAKRLGIIYTPVFGGFSDKTLADRIHDAGRELSSRQMADSATRRSSPSRTPYTDPALDRYIAADRAVRVVREALASLSLDAAQAEQITASAADAVRGEITVERRDAMRGVGRALVALTESGALDAADASRVRTAIARALVDARATVERVVVVRYTAQADVPWREGRDVWAHELIGLRDVKLLEAARSGRDVTNGGGAAFIARPRVVRAVWAIVPPLPVDAEFPLFFIYTSGSTGKPKGVVHVHGG